MKRKLMAVFLSLSMVMSLAGCHAAVGESQTAGLVSPLSAHADTTTLDVQGNQANAGTGSEGTGSTAQQTDGAAQQADDAQEQPAAGDGTVNAQTEAKYVPKTEPDGAVVKKLSKEFSKHTEDAQSWLYYYLFGVSTTESTQKALTAQSQDATATQTDAEPSDEEISEALMKFLSETQYLVEDECKTTAIQGYVNLSNRTRDEIYNELEAKDLLRLKAREIYDSMSPQTQNQVLKKLSLNTVPAEDISANQPGKQIDLAGEGYQWLESVIQDDEAANRLWDSLNPETQKKLIASVEEDTEEKKDRSDSTGTESTQPEPTPHDEPSLLLIVFIAMSAFLLIALIVALVLFLRRMNEMEKRVNKERNEKRKLAQELEQSKETQKKTERSATHSAAISPAMRTQFQNSPTRVSAPQRPQQYSSQPYREPAPDVRQPVEGTKPVRTGIGAAAAAAASQRDSASAQAASISAAQKAQNSAADNQNVIDGYYAVTDKCREDARYNLDVRLVLEKRSAQPVDPPLPYIVYGDRSVALNMDYFNRVGGSRQSNERAWDSMMNAATQIERCFNIRSVSTGSVTTPAGAAGRRILSIRRGRLNEDGTVALKGEIVLE